MHLIVEDQSLKSLVTFTLSFPFLSVLWEINGLQGIFATLLVEQTTSYFFMTHIKVLLVSINDKMTALIK